MIFTFPTSIRLIDLTMICDAATIRGRWLLIGCVLIFASVGLADDNPSLVPSDATIKQIPNVANDTFDTVELPDDDNAVKPKRTYGTAVNGLSGFIELETTVNSITDEIKGGKSLAEDEGKKLLIELKRLTEQMSALRGRVDQLGQSPLGRQTLLQIQLDEAKLKCAKLIPERGDDHPEVKKAVREIEILSELISELAEEQASGPSRTFIVPAQGRSALDLANVLGPLFIETAAISGDAASGNVVVLVKETVPPAKVAQIQAEIKARVEELKAKPGATLQVARVIHQPDAEDLNTESQIRELATRYRNSKDEKERAKLKTQINELTTKLFDRRQARRYREFQALANRVDELKAANARRYANRNDIIRRRVDELIDPSTKPDWDDVEKSTNDSSGRSQASATTPETYAVDDAGGLQRSILPSSNGSEPQAAEEATYSGKKASEWLGVLRRERNSERLPEALRALYQLRHDIDSNVLLAELLQAIRRLDRNSDSYGEIVSDVEEILLQLINDRRVSADQVAQMVVEEVVNFPTNLAVLAFLRQFLSQLVPQTARQEKLQSGVNRSLLQGIRSRKARLIPALAVAAEDSNELRAMVTEISWLILAQDSIHEFPSLVEVLRSVCDQLTEPSHSSIRMAAAGLLANSGLDTNKVWDIVSSGTKVALQTPQSDDSQFSLIVQCLIAVGKNVPQAEPQIIEVFEAIVGRIETNLTKVAKVRPNSRENLTVQLEIALNVLLIAPVQAELFIPRLREHFASVKTKIANGEVANRPIAEPILKLVDEYLDQIVIAARDAKPEAESQKQQSSQPGNEIKSSAPNANQVSKSVRSERTYDGVTYGDWLRLLETERKPERLAAAMEAVSKLALEKDLPRIARMIFLAEGGFEREKNKAVVDAGRAALNRLPAPVVFSELLAALSDTESYRSGRDFQAEVIGRVGSESYKPLFEEHLDEFVTLATRALEKEPSDRDAKFLSSIVNVCVEFRRPPKDFPQLMTPSLQYFSKGLPTKSTYGEDWIEIARWLVQYDPHIPGLKQVLVAQLGKNNLHVVDLLGELTLSGGPDTVPELIQHFELLVKQMGVQIVEYDRQHSDPSSGLRQEQPAICAQIVKVLSMFGENQLAGDFLAKLARYVPARSEAFKWNNDMPMNTLFQQNESAQTAVRQFKVAPDPERCQVRLPDFFKLNGYWKLRSVQPRSIRVHGIEWSMGDELKNGENVISPISSLWPDEWGTAAQPPLTAVAIVEEGKSPKEISVIPKPGGRFKSPRIEGIYTLTEVNLVIQLARPGTPRPAKFELEDEAVKRDQVQLTFDREKETPSFYVDPNR